MIPSPVETETSEEGGNIIFLCTENVLLTVHEESIPTFDQLSTERSLEAWLPNQSTAALVSGLQFTFSLEYERLTKELAVSIASLEERMDREPDTVDVAEIMRARSELLAIDRVVSEQIPCTSALCTTDKPFFRVKDARDYMNCALSNLQRLDKSVDRLDKRIESLRLAFQSNAQDKTNQRLAVLTILSAVFLPISFLVGVWGMNFDQPETKLPFAYPVALGVMALIAAGLCVYFRKTGWFE